MITSKKYISLAKKADLLNIKSANACDDLFRYIRNYLPELDTGEDIDDEYTVFHQAGAGLTLNDSGDSNYALSSVVAQILRYKRKLTVEELDKCKI